MPIKDKNNKLIKSSIKKKEVVSSIANLIAESIPVVGSVIAEGLAFQGKVKQTRFNIFTEKLKVYFESSSNQKIDEEFLRSEDFAQFFETVIRKVVDTKSEEKINIFKEIVVNKIKAKEVQDFSESFLHLVHVLNEKQIELLFKYSQVGKKPDQSSILSKAQQASFDLVHNYDKMLAEKTTKNRVKIKAKKKAEEKVIEKRKPLLSEATQRSNAEYASLMKPEYEVYIQDLISKGLLMDLTDKNKFGFRIIIITQLGGQFIEFIKGK